MPDTTTGTQIGSVVSFSGSVWAVSEGSHRPLTEGAPVYKGEEIVTEADSNVEIRFLDDTVLGQGGDSAVRLDDYVFSGDDGNLDFHMIKGVLRVVSGELVKANPENFNLTTPMATIGIRGTEVMVQIDHDREFIGVDKLGEGHTVLISNAFNQVVIDRAGMFSGVDFDGSLIVPDEMPESFISTMVQAAPLTILGDPPRSMGDPQEITPPQFYQTIGNQSGEYRPGVGQEQAWQGQDGEDEDEDDDGEIQLTEAEIEALLAMETAAGGDEPATPGESLGRVVEVSYAPYTPNSDPGGSQAAPPEDGTEDPVSTNDGDDPPPVEDGTEPVVGDPPGDDAVAADSGATPPPPPSPPAEDEPPQQDGAPPDGDAAVAEDQTVVQDPDAENTPVTHNVLDAGGEASLVAAVLAQDSPLEGEVTFDADGAITYVPLPGEEGQAVIEYTVEDGDGTLSSARLTITLTSDSEPTVTADDATGVEADGVLAASGTVAADFGADGDNSSLTLSATSATWDARTATLTADDQSWSVTLDDDGYDFIQYGPLAEASGTEPGAPLTVDVTVTATDGDGDTATDVFSVSLTDDGPVVVDAAATQGVEDAPITYNVFTEGDADPGLFGGSLVAAELADDSPCQGRVVFDADGSITFAPVGGETGTVLIDYVVEDADGDTGMAQLAITLAADSVPVITATNVSGDETGSLATGSGLLSVDFGADGEGAVIALAAAGATWDGETATLSADDGSWAIAAADGEYAFTQYAPLDHADVTDPDDPFIIDVSVTATDSDGSVSAGSFTVTVDDDGPTATDATFVQDTPPDEPVSYNVFNGGDALTGMDDGSLTGAALAGDGDYGGTVTYGADGTITYTPVEGETGTVHIDYMVTDGDGDSATASLSIDLAREDMADGEEYLPGNGADVILGGTGDDTLDGAQGRDVIFGTGGNDVLIGGNSRDAILGGPGHDWMYGGHGNDLLIGGEGFDVLSGGKGTDTFAYTSPYEGTDTILDFQAAVDIIRLYESGFDLQDEIGALDPGRFAVVDTATYEGGIDFAGASSGIVYASQTDCAAGTLYFDPNDTVYGDEIALASVTECDGENLTAEDIELA